MLIQSLFTSASILASARGIDPTGDVFSSTFELAQLLKIEKRFSEQIFHVDDAKVAEFATMAYPKGPLKMSETDFEAHVAHPLNAFAMMKRMGLDVARAKLKQRLEEIQVGEIATVLKTFPSLKDYEAAESSLGLLQEAYALNITALSEGVLRPETLNGDVEMTSDYAPSWTELAEIGVAVCNRGSWAAGLEWLRVALLKYPGDGPKLFEYYKGRLRDGRRVHDQLLDKRGAFGPDHKCNTLPFDETLRKKKKFKKKKQNGRQFVPLFSAQDQTKDTLRENFFALCKDGEFLRTPIMDAELSCFFLHHWNPYLRLGPFKLEEKNRLPYVALFRDFMSESETSYYRDWTRGKLERSVHGGSDDTKATLLRTSKQTWMDDRVFDFNLSDELALSAKVFGVNLNGDDFKHDGSAPLIPSDSKRFMSAVDKVGFAISKRLETATELQVLPAFASEPYQIANYGLGGQYGVHFDSQGFFDDAISTSKGSTQLNYNRVVGDRLVTAMAYLSDVEFGGATAFPLTGNVVRPKRGDLVLWFNLLRNGSRDRLTYHGGCPVLVGSKWITNKWINYNDQFLKFPCSIEPNRPFDIIKRWRNQKS